jgi:hypothetical protein
MAAPAGRRRAGHTRSASLPCHDILTQHQQQQQQAHAAAEEEGGEGGDSFAMTPLRVLPSWKRLSSIGGLGEQALGLCLGEEGGGEGGQMGAAEHHWWAVRRDRGVGGRGVFTYLQHQCRMCLLVSPLTGPPVLR